MKCEGNDHSSTILLDLSVWSNLFLCVSAFIKTCRSEYMNDYKRVALYQTKSKNKIVKISVN